MVVVDEEGKRYLNQLNGDGFHWEKFVSRQHARSALLQPLIKKRIKESVENFSNWSDQGSQVAGYSLVYNGLQTGVRFSNPKKKIMKISECSRPTTIFILSA